jgi:hypothetical protein
MQMRSRRGRASALVSCRPAARPPAPLGAFSAPHRKYLGGGVSASPARRERGCGELGSVRRCECAVRARALLLPAQTRTMHAP